MKLIARHIGLRGYGISRIIELTIEGNSSTIIEDVTNLDSTIDEEFITSLRSIADELEEQNDHIRLIANS